ncbi:MAG: hypothetical protein WCP96_00245 [Methylococcaceae bacterium]
MTPRKTPKYYQWASKTVSKINAIPRATGKGKKDLVLVKPVFMFAVLKTVEALRNNKEIEPSVK